MLCFCFNFHVSKIWLPAQRACWNNIYKRSEFPFLPAVPSCEALGVEDPNIVPDAQITASSNYLSYYPRKGRLNGDSGWCQQSSKITDNYIQVDMGAGRTVCGVATQGKANGSFIKSYRLSFSTDGTSWTAYKEQNVEKVQHVTVTFFYLFFKHFLVLGFFLYACAGWERIYRLVRVKIDVRIINNVQDKE